MSGVAGGFGESAADRHVAVVDLGYGDAGKGTVVDWLCATRPVRAVVRFNGGGQAAHTVVLPDGRAHTFAQFGAGTFRPGVRTHLSRFMVVDPLALAGEATHLAALGVPDALDRLTVDREALLATPYHRAANQAREIARGADRHGSCGMGVGESMAYALAHPDSAPTVGDCLDPGLLRHRLALLRERLAAELGPLDAPPVADTVAAYTAFADRVSIVDRSWAARLLRAGTVVFEGAQGVLLDEWHGFHPYTTWSTTTFANVDALLAEAGMSPEAVTRLGVLRVLTPRHGPGPLVTEDPALRPAERHNGTNRWQGRFRFGHFDAVAHRYAMDVAGGVDALALTHLDLLGRHRLRLCQAYDWTDRLPAGPPGDLDRQAALTRRLLTSRPSYGADPGPDPNAWVAAVEAALGVPVRLTSHGPTAADKTARRAGYDRRTWVHPTYRTTIGVAVSKSVPPYQRVSPRR
ncbi:adenylosuccinate synthetase [Solwaraspora sp. WMMB335]|uniref:adenylosuccinate synthetase n=1 Tax=Solwaraspora sp. WMMB335 TaxID=3404118 RepID=UPI003B943CE1